MVPALDFEDTETPKIKLELKVKKKKKKSFQTMLDSSAFWRDKKNFGEGDGSGGREKNFGKGTAGRKEKTYLYDAIARVLKSEIRVLKF